MRKTLEEYIISSSSRASFDSKASNYDSLEMSCLDDKGFLFENLNERIKDEIPINQLTFIKAIDTIKIISRTAIPTMICMVADVLTNLINTSFIGHLGDPILLGSIGLSNSWILAVPNGVIMCFDNGLITVAAQAYGAKDHRLIGLYYQKNLVILFTVFIFIWLILWESKNIFLALGIEEDVSIESGRFCKWMILSTIGTIIYDSTKNYLIAQNIYFIQPFIQTFSIVMSIFWSFIFINVFELKLIGAAISKTLTEFTNATLIILYIKIYKPCPDSWIPWTKECLEDVIGYLKEVLPIGSLVYLEFVSYELTAIFAGSLHDSIGLAAHTSCLQFVACIFMIPLGISTAVLTYVGNSVGAGSKNKAQKFAVCGLILILFTSILECIFIIYGKSLISFFFTNDDDVTLAIHQILIYYGIICYFDNFQCIIAGIARGLGKQKQGMYGFIFSYYIIALPTSYILSNVLGVGIKGIWYGLGLGSIALVITVGYIIAKADWIEQIKYVRQRIQLEGKKGALGH